MEITLVKIVEEHDEQIIFLGILTECIDQGGKSFHAFCLQPVSTAQTSFEEGDGSFRYDPLNIFVTGQRDFLEVNAELFADAGQSGTFARIDEGDSRSGCAGSSRSTRTVDVGFGIFGGFILNDMRELWQINSACGHIGGD